MGFSSSPLHLRLLFLNFTLLLLFLSRDTYAIATTTIKGVDLVNPVIDVTPSFLNGKLPNRGGLKDVCERVKVTGYSVLDWRAYSKSIKVTLIPSAEISERLHSKIQVCFHWNDSLGLCHCGNDEWRTVQNGVWSSVMAPYDHKYIDVKFIGEISGPVRISVEEDFQRWRLLCLAVGFLLLLLAPIISSWVPFYYSTSMVIGVFLLVIILLFQGMKLLPTGRKNIFYLSIYGSVVGAGTYILHHISMIVNSILINLGLSEEMHNPVYLFVVLGIVLTGAALGYWIVRKFVISEDGSVDVGVAQFMRWAMRIISAAFIFQSSLDIRLTLVAFLFLYAVSHHIHAFTRRDPDLIDSHSQGGSHWLQQGRQVTAKHNRTEFLSRSCKTSSGGKMWGSPQSTSTRSNSPVKGLMSPSTRLGTKDQQHYFSTFHKTPNRKKFTKKEWEDFTRESTQQAVKEWGASPEVAAWLIENADRIQLIPSDYSSEETVGSESDSTDETITGSGKKFCLFNW